MLRSHSTRVIALAVLFAGSTAGCHRASPTPSASSDEASTSASVSPPADAGSDGGFVVVRADCAEPAAEGCILLAVDYAYGRGMPKDEARAAQVLRAACDAKNPTGCTFLATAYAFGRGVPKEKWKARGLGTDTLSDTGRKSNLYEYACDAGDAPKCAFLAAAYAQGVGVTKDSAKASALYARAAQLLLEGCEKKSDMMACAVLGQLELSGNIAAKNEAQAMGHLEKACNGDDATGCETLAVAYQQGQAGRPKDIAKALALFVKACNGGEDMGCENAGHLYEDGKGVPADKESARRVYKTACDRGDSSACSASKRVGGP